jgi:hypothetical protein
MKRMVVIGAVALLMALASGAGAQSKNAFAEAEAFAKSEKENAELLRHYTWNMRVSVNKDGDQQPVRLYLVRFTMEGTLQKTLLTPAPELRGGPFMRMIEKSKMKSAKEAADKLAEVVKQYTTPTPGTMLDFFMKAKFKPSAGDMLEISGTDFVSPGDTAEYWVDKKTKKPHRFAFSTTMDGNELTGTVHYDQVPKGPLYAARIDMALSGANETATIETFNYQKGN